MVIVWTKKDPEFRANKILKKKIKNGEVETVKIDINEVIKRKDTEDFGTGYYFQLGNKKSIYLQNQYVNKLNYEEKFPNSSFKIIETKTDKNLIDLKPLRTLKSFSTEQYKSGNFHYNDQVLELHINEIK